MRLAWKWFSLAFYMMKVVVYSAHAVVKSFFFLHLTDGNRFFFWWWGGIQKVVVSLHPVSLPVECLTSHWHPGWPCTFQQDRLSKFKTLPTHVVGLYLFGLPSWPCSYLLSLKPGIPVFTDIFTDAKTHLSKHLWITPLHSYFQLLQTSMHSYFPFPNLSQGHTVV
jgi:hypothetical protein